MRGGVAGAFVKPISSSTSSTMVRSSSSTSVFAHELHVVVVVVGVLLWAVAAWHFSMGSPTCCCLFGRLSLQLARLQSFIVTFTCDAGDTALTRAPAGWLLQLMNRLNVATLAAQPARCACWWFFRLWSGSLEPTAGAPYFSHDGDSNRLRQELLRAGIGCRAMCEAVERVCCGDDVRDG